MIKKLAVFFTVLLTLLAMAPAAVSAAENEIIYGTIVSVDKEKNEITVRTEDGQEKIISVAGSGMQIGSQQQLSIDDLQPGQNIGTLAQISGDSIISEKLTIVPELPLYKHLTGVVTGQSGSGLTLQTREGEIPCALPEGAEGMKVGEAFFAIAEIPAGNGAPQITGFEPFEETIEGIGNNLKQLGNDSPIKPEEVAIRMVNELGAMTQNVPEQTKTLLQEKLGQQIETSMPDAAWTNMNQEAIQNMNAEGAGFVPPQAFGQMKPETIITIPEEAAAKINPEAGKFMQPGALPPGWSIAPDGGPMPPGAPGQGTAPEYPDLPGNPGVPVPTGPGGGTPPPGPGGTPTGPGGNSPEPPDGTYPELPGDPGAPVPGGNEPPPDAPPGGDEPPPPSGGDTPPPAPPPPPGGGGAPPPPPGT